MSNYTPGEGYDKGFACRMNGGQKPSQALYMNDPFWNEYNTGWNDAEDKILKEARNRHGVEAKNNYGNFIQD